jgi:hypothetical protein
MEQYSLATELRYHGHRPISFVAGENNRITGELGDEVDVRSWKSPPHVALANMALEPRMLEAFSRRYGVLGEVEVTYSEVYKAAHRGEFDSTPTELLNIGAADLVKQTFVINGDEFADAQKLLRLAWLGDRSILKGAIMQAVKQGDYQVILPGEMRNEQTILAARNLWQYSCFLFVLDYSAGKARKCANPDCTATPYFIQQRKDQEYCGHACAVIATNARRATEKAGRKK